jgi:hypothetical protein
MRTDILWDRPALFVFHRLPRSEAEDVDRAVIALAERGEGRLEWAAPYHRLRAGKYELALVIDARVPSITVLHIFRTRR